MMRFSDNSNLDR
uniref:Uncharacterized protein n=1 Tax=Arundo donax TaxID=35708 RepID=A0A0A9B125_ARUDO